MKRAVITILGIQGGYVTNKKAILTDSKHIANYYIEDKSTKKGYFNTLPLLIEKYSEEYEIIPIYTEDSKIFNEEVFNELYINKEVIYDEKYFIKDEKNFKEVFSLFNRALETFDEVIIDVTHGFRHLPLLMLVELLIHNFKDTKKIKNILFAKEEIKHTPQQQGLYEIIDLKEYLELSNISFILTTFQKNYTVANHIKSVKYQTLIDALNNFSNDLMALNLNYLFEHSIDALKDELKKIEDVSISTQAEKLLKHIDDRFKKADKRYLTYYNLSKELFDKKYMLISLSLLNESLRLYIKTTIKQEHTEIVEKVEKFHNDDLYFIGDFFVKLYRSKYKSFKNRAENEKKEVPITTEEFSLIKQSFPSQLKEKIVLLEREKNLIDHIGHKRNNLAHANSSTVSFDDIHDDIKKLFQKFEERCIN